MGKGKKGESLKGCLLINQICSNEPWWHASLRSRGGSTNIGAAWQWSLRWLQRLKLEVGSNDGSPKIKKLAEKVRTGSSGGSGTMVAALKKGERSDL